MDVKKGNSSIVKLGMVTNGEFKKELVEKSYFANAINKPVGGLWLSPLVGEESEWTMFCKKEMPRRLLSTKFYEAMVTLDDIQIWSEPPSRSELNRLLQDETRAGFLLIGIHMGWDVQSLWLKDDRNIITLNERRSRLHETA